MRRIFYMKMALVSLMLLLFTGGCNHIPPSAEELANANFGSVPGDYQNRIKSEMELSLFDSESARYKFGLPFKARTCMGGCWQFGHGVFFSVNSKNRYGGYVGYEGYSAFFKPDGTMIIDWALAIKAYDS